MRNFVGLCVARAIAQSFSPHRRVRLEHLGQDVESRVAFVPSESSLDLFESSRCSKPLGSIKIDATIPALHELNPLLNAAQVTMRSVLITFYVRHRTHSVRIGLVAK